MTRARSQTKQRELTFEEYMAIPETMRPHEVIDGVILMSPTPTVNHQLILQNLSDTTSPHVRLHELREQCTSCGPLRSVDTKDTEAPGTPTLSLCSSRPTGSSARRSRWFRSWKSLPISRLRVSFSPSNRPVAFDRRNSTRLCVDPSARGLASNWTRRASRSKIHVLAEGGYRLEHRFEADEMKSQSQDLPGLAQQSQAALRVRPRRKILTPTASR